MAKRDKAPTTSSAHQELSPTTELLLRILEARLYRSLSRSDVERIQASHRDWHRNRKPMRFHTN